MSIVYGWSISLGLAVVMFLIHHLAVSYTRPIMFSGRKYSHSLGIFLLLIAHIVESATFALGYWLCASVLDIGSLGDGYNSLRDYLYYSLVTYTSLGLGDILPIGELRLLTGVEALAGLLLIGWSASLIFSSRDVTLSATQ